MKPEEVDDALTALADPIRRRVVEMLAHGPRQVADIVAEFDVSAPAVSRHLRVLRTKGLVEHRPDLHDSRIRMYELRREPFEGLGHWLGTIEQYWTGQLDAFKHHAETSRRSEPS